MFDFRQRDGKDLILDDKRFEGGNTEHPSLRMKEVSRNDIGTYTCLLKNSVGSSTSDNSIYLNVICKFYCYDCHTTCTYFCLYCM